MTLIASLGLLLIISSIHLESFGLSLIGTSFVGIGTSLGGATNLGFMKAFDSSVVVGYSSGTGFAGVFGSLIYILMIYLNIRLDISLGSLILLYVAYFVFFK